MSTKKPGKKLTWLVVILLSVGIVSVILLISQEEKKYSPLVSTPDLRNHPIYAKYEFSPRENVINLGTQPVYLPTGLISETISRDKILSRALLELGFKLKHYAFLKGDDVNFFLQHNDLQVGIGGDMPTIVISAVSEVISPILLQEGFVSIIADSPLLLRELRGKRIGYAYGSNAHYALLDALANENLTAEEVELIAMDVNEMADALSKADIKAFSAWEPTPALALKKYPGFVRIYQKLTTGYMYFQRSFYDKNPDATRHLVAATLRAYRWMQGDRKNLAQASIWSKQAAESLLGREIPLSSKEIMGLALRDILGKASTPLIDQDYLRLNGPLFREFEFLKKLGKIPSSTQWNKLSTSFDRQILSEVLSNPQKYKVDEFQYEITEITRSEVEK